MVDRLVRSIPNIRLAVWYVPLVDHVFASIDFIMREVSFGWLARYSHSNGASFFFLFVYLHIGRAMYFGSYAYPRQRVWYTGMIIFLLMIVTAFFGYVLPWGQMSYWAVTVITNLVSVIPFFGKSILIFFVGRSCGRPANVNTHNKIDTCKSMIYVRYIPHSQE